MQKKIKEMLENGILVSPDFLEGKEAKINLSQEVTVTNYSINEKGTTGSNVEVTFSYVENTNEKEFKDFVKHYNNRYITIRDMLRQRQEFQGICSINKAKTYDEREQVVIIGMVFEKSTTNNGNIILTLEDQTGVLKAIVMKHKENLYDEAKDITEDEVLGIIGVKGKGIIFVDEIIFPDVPLNKELKKSPEDVAAVFISDIHIGSEVFLKDSFENFIGWLKGNKGSDEQRENAKKVKYLFIIGDLVEGVGIFPGQEKELLIKDIHNQYNKFTEYIKELPKDIKIIICPGNHDALRIDEPQPPIPKKYLPELYEMENIYFVTSPGEVRIAKTDTFGGFDVLLYHGYSFPYYANNIESIRTNGGLEKTENIMKYLIKKRHLAPTHGSTRFILGDTKDHLIIKNLPDFFVTGHVHRASIKNYRNVTLLNCSCWISQTPYQEKRGLVPEPSRAVYVNLNTRETRLLNFDK